MVTNSRIQTAPRTSSKRGLTLVETMIGTVLFAIVILAVSGALLAAYRMILTARYQQRAMNALVSIAEQFQNTSPTDASTGTRKTLFTVTTAATGEGMGWDKQKQAFAYPGANSNTVSGTATGLTVPLNTVGQDEGAIRAVIMREVRLVASGSSPESGQLFEGTFTATFNLLGGDRQLALRVLRNINQTDLDE